MNSLKKYIKPTKSKNILWILLKSYVQTAIFWIVFLVIIPMGILYLETDFATLKISPQKTLGSILFMCFSFMGLYSAFVMSYKGEGTPLPIDCAVKLVKTGPYKILRNPMAVSGIGQGLSVGLYFGSILVLLYSICGAILWHTIIRPIEESEMANRFGEPYLQYKMKTKNWIPRFRR